MELLTTGFYVSPKGFIVISIVFPVLGAVAVFLRFLSRLRYGLSVKADDWLCLPALACVGATSGLFIWGATTKQSLGYRLAPGQTTAQLLKQAPEKMRYVLEIEYYVNPICAFGSGLIRLSFLYFYRRIFRGKVFQILNWSLIGFFTFWLVVILVTFLSVCRNHLPHHFQTAVSQEQCRDLQGALSIIGFVFDLVTLSLPFPWIWRLQMPTTQKAMVSSVFLLGLFTVGASAVRMAIGIDAMTWKMGVYMDVMGLKSTTDLLGYICVTMFWTYIEIGTGMVVVCLPSFGPFLQGKTMFRITKFIQSSTSSEPIRRLTKRLGSSSTSSEVEFAREREKSGCSIMVTNTVDQYTVPV